MANHPNRNKPKRHYSVIIGEWAGFNGAGTVTEAPVIDEGRGNVFTVYAASVGEAIREANEDGSNRDNYHYTVEAWPDVAEYIIQARPGFPPFARCATYSEALDAQRSARTLGTGYQPMMIAYCADGSQRVI